ncbi:MAG: L,D-transpeptidase/peptidoglycan binding protein [Lachnospiraceae bacterium]|nr:L,D-transpeptidase/peptidoglycan binding protein [Lachnospiraceae bacterium]
MEEEKKSKAGMAVILGVLAIMLILAGIYIFRAFVYKGRFYKGTIINGEDVSEMTVEEAEKILREKAEREYTFTLKTVDGKQVKLTGPELGYKATVEGLEAVKEEQGYFDWPAKNGKGGEFTVKTRGTCDPAVIQKTLKKLDIMDASKQEQPENAYIVKDEEKGYLLVPDTHGTVLAPKKVRDAIAAAVDAEKTTVDLEAEGCYKKANITVDSPQIRDVMDKVEAYTNATITYELGDKKEVIDSSVSNAWIDIDENGEAYIKEQLVREYVKYLAEEYSTYYKTRSFKTTGGDIVDIDPGNYGYKVDREAEFNQIIADLNAGKPVKREICYSCEGYTHNNEDIGDTYIEISITDQHLWYYENGELILDCDVRTGCTGRGQGTPTGCYEVQNKFEKIVLVGADYASPVDYWIGFIGRKFGMHDASWVDKFGGDTYKWNGSHGCVNMPLDTISELFERVELGIPVVIYWV